MINKRLAILLTALGVLLGACSQGAAPSSAPEPDSSPASASAPESESRSDGAQDHASDAPASSSAPNPESRIDTGSGVSSAPSSDGVIEPGASEAPPPSSSQQTVTLSSSESDNEPQGKTRAGEALMYGQGVTLHDWQWIDKDRMLLGVGYEGEKPSFRAVLYNRRDHSAQELYQSAATEARSTFYEDSAELIAGDKMLNFQKPGGTQLAVADAPDYSNVFPEDVDYQYYDIRISSDSRYYIYERAPNGYTYEGKPMSDRVIVDTTQNTTTSSPLQEISFPFDVRVSPKTIRWIGGTNRLLADVLLPVEGSYGDFTRHMYVIDAPTGRYLDDFSPPLDDAQELVLRDTHGTKLLFERPGEPYELIAYDYKSGKSQSVAKLEGSNLKGTLAKFSLPGDEVALLRARTDLTPEFYPVENLD